METQARFVLADMKPVRPIQGWHEFLAEGNGYLTTAAAAFARRIEAFNAGILYNLIAMAIEKFVMTALMHRGTMPYNHTMADLVAAMEETFPGSVSDIRKELLALDSYQDICDLDGFSIAPPGMDKIPAMLKLAGKIQQRVSYLVRHDL